MSQQTHPSKEQSARQIVKNYYLQKHNSTVEQSQIVVSPLFSLTNDVYSVIINNQSLLLKIYQPQLQEFTDNVLQIQIVCRLAERGLYPKILFYSPKLRIEEYINSISVEQRTIEKKKLVSIVTKLADFSCHFSDLVIKYNQQNNIKNKYSLDNLIETFENIYKAKKIECPQLIEQSKQDLQCIFYDASIMTPFKQIVSRSLLILCHNDCHLGNVLSSQQEYIVDYQFCQFNLIGYDIGNFLNEWATEYSNTFQIRQENEMEEALANQIVTIYYTKISEKYECGNNIADWLYYTKLGRVLSHFFWMIIGLKQINHAKITFSMIYYIKRRKQEFLKHFKELLAMKK